MVGAVWLRGNAVGSAKPRGREAGPDRGERSSDPRSTGYDPADREFFRSISPIEFADRITGHLVVLHGANDPRVPVAEADQIVSAVRAAGGGEVTYLRFPDEGHGIARLENRITAYQAVARSLDGSIGGAGMPCWGR